MNKIRSVLVGAAMVFLMAGAACAETPGVQTQGDQAQGADQKRADAMHGRMFKDLGLSPEQEKKVEENRKAQREEMSKLRKEIVAKQEALQDALKSPSLTMESVTPAVNEIKALQGQMLDQRIRGIFAVKDILTPEQFAKFQQMTANRQGNRKERIQQWREKKSAGLQGKE